jgi:hypothetical protein
MNRAEPRAHTIQARVRVFADLRRYLPRAIVRPRCCHPSADASVASLLGRRRVPTEQQRTAGLNRRLAQRSTALADEDELDLLSPMEGG